MKRIAIFAHYDKNNLIQDFVIYYLSELKKCVEKIIFVSDSDVLPEELKKIENLVYHSIVGRHGEYDFGSYKRGFLYAKENELLKDCEELIFANDSCYAPLYPFEDMEGKCIQAKINHLQSYFVIFKPQVFNSKIFSDFISSVKKENTKEEIVANLEVRMTELLEENGFNYDSYSSVSKKVPSAHINAYYELIKEDKLPFFKRTISLYTLAEYHYPLFMKHLIKKYTNYNYNLIQDDVNKNARKLTLSEHAKFWFKSFRHHIFRRKRRDRLVCFLGKWYSY